MAQVVGSLVPWLLVQIPGAAQPTQPPAATSSSGGSVSAEKPSPKREDPRYWAAEKASDRAYFLFKQKDEKDVSWLEIANAYKTALALWKKTGDLEKTYDTVGKVVVALQLQGDWGQARKVLKDSIEELQKADNRNRDVDLGLLLVLEHGIASLQEDRRASISAQRKLVQMIRLGRIPSQLPLQQVLCGMAMSYESLGDYEGAINVLDECMAEATRIADPEAILRASLDRIAWRSWLSRVTSANDMMLDLYQKNKAELMTLLSPFAKSSYSLQAIMLVNQSCAADKYKIFQESIWKASTTDSHRETTTANTEKPLAVHGDASISKYRQMHSWQKELQELNKKSNIFFEGKGYESSYRLRLASNFRRLELARLMQAWGDESDILVDQASLYLGFGEPQRALDALNQALAIEQKLERRPNQIKVYTAIGDVYQSLGDNKTAIRVFQGARHTARLTRDATDEAWALRRIAKSYSANGEHLKARNALAEAVQLLKQEEGCGQAGAAMLQLATSFNDTNEPDQANAFIAEILAIVPRVNSEFIRHSLHSGALNQKARLLLKKGLPARALAVAQDALPIAAAKMAVNPELYARILATVAESQVALGELPQAIGSYHEQVKIWKTINQNPERALSLYAIAKLQRRLGDRASALATINEAIDIVESMRKQVVDPELRTSFFASKQDIFSFKIDLLLEWEQLQRGAGHAAEAFHTSERSRARTLLELLDDARADIRQGIAPELLEQEKTLQYRRTTLDKRFQQAFSEKGDPSLLPQLQQERQQLLQQTQELRQAIRARSPRYAALTDPEPLTLQQVQQQLLDPDTLLLQFALGEKRSHLFVVSHNNLQVVSLPPAAQIESLVSALREPLTKNQLPAEINSRAAALSQQILGPASQAIARHRRLIVVADGSLHLVPFAVLPQGDQPLLERHQLLQLPSSSSLALLQRQPSSRPASIAILADPIFSSDDSRVRVFAPAKPPSTAPPNPVDLRALSLSRAAATLSTNPLKPQPWAPLPGTRREAEAIQRLFPPQQAMVALDEQANLHWAQDPKLARYSILHLATHGIFNTQEPALSGLVLSLVDREGKPQDGFLQLADVFNLKLAADLVVLSACETGLAEQVKGEGLVGLTRGFLYAGSSRVLVSLWKVDDAATAKFMEYFYKALLQRRLPPSQALVAAQQQLRSNPRLASPYYWGAFVLQGEW